MSQRSSSPSFKKNAYGGPVDQGRGKQRGSGFSFDSENSKSRERRPKELSPIVHMAYKFLPSEKDPFIKGVTLLEEEGTDALFFKCTSTVPSKDVKEQLVHELKDITKAMNKRQPVFDRNTLISAVFETSAKAGALIFLDIPGSGGIRLYSQKPGSDLSIDEYRTRICYAEIRFDEEPLRQEYKKSLKDEGAGFRLPGFDGKQLQQRGIDVLYPLFDNADERKAKVPHQHVIRLDAGTECEVMFEYRHRNGTPNWFHISVDANGVPSAYNIRSEAMPYMIEARRRKTEEEDKRKADLQARRTEF